MPPDVLDRADVLERRISAALSLLSLVESIPGTGTHGERCTHRDCLALRVRKILRGEA